MPILLVAIGTCFLASVWLTQSLFRVTWRVERQQIAVDNAAIVFGQSDASTFHRLVDANRTLERLELAHHPIHACAMTPQPVEPACVEIDETIEEEIAGYREVVWGRARFEWNGTPEKARREARRLDAMALTDRPESIPVTSVRCSLCGREMQWELDTSAPITYAVWAQSLETHRRETRVELLGRNLKAGESWQYRLGAEPAPQE
jgi:hypothetical protein